MISKLYLFDCSFPAPDERYADTETRFLYLRPPFRPGWNFSNPDRRVRTVSQ